MAAILSDVWRAVGTELVIFIATVVAALLLRRFTELAPPRGAKGKEVPKVPTSPMQRKLQGQEQSPTVCSPGGDRHAAASVPAASVQSLAVVLDRIVDSMKDQASLRVAGRAITEYNEELRSRFKVQGLRIQEVARYSQRSPLDMYATLVHCAIRAGRHHLVEALIDDMAEQGVQRTLSFYESAMKQLAGQRQFHLALAVYDRLASDGLKASAVTCSCLIGFATEVGLG